MNPAIVIPTFHTGRGRRGSRNISQAYDHPTPLSKNGELPRCLQSLLKVRGIGQIIILVAADPGVEIQACEKVLNIASQFPALNIIVIGTPEHLLIQQRMEQLGLGKLGKEVGLVRLQRRAQPWPGGGQRAGLRLRGLSGRRRGRRRRELPAACHVRPGQAHARRASRSWPRPASTSTPRARTSRRARTSGTTTSGSRAKRSTGGSTKAMRGPRLSRSNHVCGGCLALHKEAFKRLSFDPWIMRGEDLDYMLNLRMYGSDIWFDNKWSLRHLPPESDERRHAFPPGHLPLALRIPQDGVQPHADRPAAGEARVARAVPRSVPGAGHRAAASASRRFCAAWRARTSAPTARRRRPRRSRRQTYAQRNCAKYFEFQFVWPELMARMEGDQILRTALLQSAARSIAGADVDRLEQLAEAAGIDPGSTSEIRLNVEE